MFGKIKRYISKGLRFFLQPPALTDCNIDRTSTVCSGAQINSTSLGRYSYIGHDCFFVNASVGSFCSIADGCRVGGAEHPIYRVSSSPVFHAGKNILNKNFSNLEPIKTPRTIIGNDVWIGANVCVKAGVTIGDGAVIGMGAVVTENVAPYEVRVGVPARPLKKRFDDKTIEKLIESKWWDWDDDKLSRLSNTFGNVEDFLRHL